MKFDPKIHHRHSIRPKDYDYAQAGGYFVTIVTRGRACLLGEINNYKMKLSVAGQIVEEQWNTIPDHFPSVELGAFVIMPNHIHAIILCRGVVSTPPVVSTPRPCA
ncbi:MAG: hypothetical protein A2X25_11430 [Chloroflexi bacterium GWB2_49_20]|nr:MAG: hypothetical protein A2X25_11430 [Chloroflexi bacterium GWB2_49_20]OGN77621.1 MAG: hypothetical protein A2X26_09700 [Chloroflexi bacterium GWC2_49_37]OGN86397.1 MAG: hypothetical protein A2X27_05855 [Chloroflexi bacterium GWD2_49_16]HBG74635.1 hypothetical protein [Anaerolineae bacterium]